MDGRDRRADPRHAIHRRQAQRIHSLLRPAGRLLAGRHGECGDVGHALLGAGPVPYRGRARTGQRRRPVARPGRRAAGGERQDRRREGRAGQGRGAGAVAERRQRALLAAGQGGAVHQLPRAPHRGARRQLRLHDRAPGFLHGARRRSGRRHAARLGPRGLASGAPAHDHPGAGPPAADHRVLPRGRKYLDRDAVFGVRAGLVLPFRRVTDRAALPANLAARDSLPMPVWSARLDLTLPPA